MKIYLVGGAVRDRLLGRPAREKDWVVVGSSPGELEAQGYQQVGKDFPVFLHPETGDEYALARTERKSGPGYHGFDVYAGADVSLEDDLQRRDLTINAIAEDEHGALVDPCGGQADIDARMLRHVSAAFSEDPLRVLRVARFAALLHADGFRVAPETVELMRGMAEAGQLSELTPERVWREIAKALATDHPDVFISTLRECGALKSILPEVDRLFGVPQPEKWHPEVDTGVHILLVLQCAARMSDELAVRFAALVHDLGKGTTDPKYWPSHRGHEERGVGLIEKVCARLAVPGPCRDLAVHTARYHTHVHKASELKPSTLLRVLESTDAFRRPERLEQLLLACEADARGRTGLEDKAYPQADLFRDAFRAAAAVDNAAIAATGVTGAAFGEELRRQRIAAIKSVET